MNYISGGKKREGGRKKKRKGGRKKGREEITEVTESMNRDHLPSRGATASYRNSGLVISRSTEFSKSFKF